MTVTTVQRPAAVRTPIETLRERRDGMLRVRERHLQAVPAAQFEFRARPDGTGGTAYSFRGYAATFETPFQMWDFWGDEYFEVLAASACSRTLANQADVQFLIGHNEASMPLARTKSGTMTLAADSTGLEVVVPSLDGRSPIVQSLASAMERGDMDEMSIGFIAVQQQWSPTYDERRITEINLNRGDVSIVCWAANPNANGASLEALPVSSALARAAAADREQRAEGEAAVEPAGTAEPVELEVEEEAADEVQPEPEPVAVEADMVLHRARVRVLQLRR